MAVVVDFGLVMAMMCVLQHDHGRDQSKTSTHEFSLKNFCSIHAHMHSHYTHHKTKTLTPLKQLRKKKAPNMYQHIIHAIYIYISISMIYTRENNIPRLSLM